MPVVLQTDRYTIRSARASDVNERYLSWFRDAETMKFVGPTLGRMTRTQHLEIIASADNRTRMFLIIEARLAALAIGWVRVQIEPRDKRAQVSLTIGDPAYRLQGGRSEVGRAVRLHLFSQADVQKVTYSVYGAHTLMLRAHDHNPDIIKEGVLRRHHFVPELGWQDVHVYAVFRESPDGKE